MIISFRLLHLGGMALILVLAIAEAAAQAQLQASVDRSRVEVGDRIEVVTLVGGG